MTKPINKRVGISERNMLELRRTLDSHMSKLGVDGDTTEKGGKSHYKIGNLLDKHSR